MLLKYRGNLNFTFISHQKSESGGLCYRQVWKAVVLPYSFPLLDLMGQLNQYSDCLRAGWPAPSNLGLNKPSIQSLMEVKLPEHEADHFHLILRLRLCGSIPPLCHIFSMCGAWLIIFLYLLSLPADHKLCVPDRWVGLPDDSAVLPVQVTSCQRTAIVANYHSIRVQHGHQLEDELVSQLLTAMEHDLENRLERSFHSYWFWAYSTLEFQWPTIYTIMTGLLEPW